jgi:hypothetical protein
MITQRKYMWKLLEIIHLAPVLSRKLMEGEILSFTAKHLKGHTIQLGKYCVAFPFHYVTLEAT